MHDNLLLFQDCSYAYLQPSKHPIVIAGTRKRRIASRTQCSRHTHFWHHRCNKFRIHIREFFPMCIDEWIQFIAAAAMAYIKAVSRVAVRKSNNGKYLLPLLFPRLNKSLCKPGAYTMAAKGENWIFNELMRYPALSLVGLTMAISRLVREG